MPDFATSSHPAVQRQLARLAALSPGADVLGLERIRALLDRLGNPERALPPVFHVAGTNGKGSTCAYLRAALEAAGHRVHAYTSPHLVRFNERVRLAGALIDDGRLAGLLDQVLGVGDDVAPSFFEVTTAAAFLAFAQEPADACVIEVGLGGRLDATNVLTAPVACGIAQLGLDHQAFLGDAIEGIAAEKAGIAKPGVPLVTCAYPCRVAAPIEAAARSAGARWLPRGGEWDAAVEHGCIAYCDAAGTLALPMPSLSGAYQADNAALAAAMLRHQQAVAVPEAALRTGVGAAAWPARLQRLDGGALAALLPANAELWLDGGHNPAAAEAVAEFFRSRVTERPFAIVLGMLANKEVAGFLAPFAGSGAKVHGVPVPGHACHDASAIHAAARRYGLAFEAAPDAVGALAAIAREARAAPIVLIAGSLYLAGTVLAANGTPPL